MTQKNFEVGDVVVINGTRNRVVIVELMDDLFVWGCPVEKCDSVVLLEKHSLVFVSDNGRDCCARLAAKTRRVSE